MVKARADFWRLAMVGLMVVSACKSDSTSPDGDGGTPGSISLSLSATSLSLEQGETGTSTATIARAGSFSGAVSIAVSGAPAGVTVSATPSSIAAGSTSSTVTVAVGGSVAAGSYTLSVRASGTGVTDATASIALTVTAAPPTGSFSLALDPASLSIQIGNEASTSVDITRTDFTGAVALTVSGAPSGVTATLDPTSATGAGSTLTVSVGGSATAGSYTLTVKGSASGLADQTASLALTVTAPSTGAGNTEWQFCSLRGLPTWFAYQDGNGPWTEVTADADHTYVFDILSGRGGVAYTTAETGSVSTQIQFGTQEELDLQGSGVCGSSDVGKTVNGSVAGLGATDQAYISLGGAAASVSGSGGSGFQLENVPGGLQDLIAGRSSLVVSGGTATVEFNKGIIRRGLEPADGSTLAVLDFEAAEAFTPEEHDLTINNLGSDGAQVVESFFTPRGAVGTLYAETSLSTATTRTFKTVPASATESGDLNVVAATAFAPGMTVPDKTRSAIKFFNAASDQTVTLGPDMGTVTVTSTSAPYVMPRVQYTIQPEYDSYFTWVASQLNGLDARTLLIAASAGYLGGAGALDLSMPDFTGVGSWDSAWALFSGVQATWSFGASGWTAIGGDGSGLPYLDGATSMSGSRIGQQIF